MGKNRLAAALFATTCLVASGVYAPAVMAAGEIKISSTNIGGVVTSAKGPEAGVWVIAETKELPTPYAKIVVTDDQGRYVLPDLPKAKYKIWVRGYGLVDSEKVDGAPGQKLDLTAVVAPDGKAAAQYYPAMYWLSLANIPQGDLPVDDIGTTLKGCLLCHQIGDKATREIPAALGTFKTHLEAWDRRVKSGPVGAVMDGGFKSMGDQRSVLSDWTDRIAKGEYPKQAPPRPSGVERNVVVTEWEWGGDATYLHDAAASDVRDPTLNANGLIYGPSQTDDIVAWVNPVTNEAGEIKIPSTAVKAGMATKDGKGLAPSPYWGDQPLWVAAALVRSAAIDHKGRALFADRFRADDEQPAYCTDPANKFAKYFPVKKGERQVGMYDPKTKQIETVDVCFTSDHNQFGLKKLVNGNKIFFGQADTIGWVDLDIWDKTHDSEKASGWVPTVIDTNGDGKITPGWTEPNQPVDPTKDHRIRTNGGGCYDITVSPTDGSIWCGGAGRARFLTRTVLGANPPETTVTEVYEPPAVMNGVAVTVEGGLDVDSEGVVWQNWRGSDHVTAFDRRKCKVLKGPTATGKQCPEGWTSFRYEDEPTFGGGTKLASDELYLMDVDRHDVLGLGKDTLIQQPTTADALRVLQPKTGTWVNLHVPYPMGFVTRKTNGRIDDPKGGWKGRGLWTSYADVPIWHVEGGKGQRARLLKI